MTGVKGGDSINGPACNNFSSGADERGSADANYGDDIDCILADNDDMTLGAIAALQAHGYFTDEQHHSRGGVWTPRWPAAGIKNGTLLETNLNNRGIQAHARIHLQADVPAGKARRLPGEHWVDGVHVERHKI